MHYLSATYPPRKCCIAIVCIFSVRKAKSILPLSPRPSIDISCHQCLSVISYFIYLLIRLRSLSEPRACWMNKLDPGIHCLCLLTFRITKKSPHPHGFYVGAGNPNSSLHTCTKSDSHFNYIPSPYQYFWRHSLLLACNSPIRPEKLKDQLNSAFSVLGLRTCNTTPDLVSCVLGAEIRPSCLSVKQFYSEPSLSPWREELDLRQRFSFKILYRMLAITIHILCKLFLNYSTTALFQEAMTFLAPLREDEPFSRRRRKCPLVCGSFPLCCLLAQGVSYVSYHLICLQSTDNWINNIGSLDKDNQVLSLKKNYQ